LDAAQALAHAGLCRGDIDGNRIVDLSDLSTLLANYGVASGASFQTGDLNGDDAVGLGDLALLLGTFGRACAQP
jgi:hypothetical protein